MIVHVLERARESGADRIIVATDHEDVARAVEAAGGEVCMTRADHQSGTERLAVVVENCAFSDHVLERARESGAERIIVATDHEDVARAVEAAGGEVCMTRADHQSGTERLAEVVEKCAFSDDTVIVNVQGDEPMIPATIIRQVADNLAQRQVGMATLAVPIHNAEEAFNPNAVKVVLDAEGYALYFSRATIPWDRDRFAKGLETVGDNFLRHLGIYGYRAGFIRRYVNWQPSPLEHIEMLEQLRVLWYGEKIHVAVAQEVPGTGVDTPEDLERVRAEMR